MILTISTTYTPATDLGYLLHKHPGKIQTFPLSFGQAQVFYPVATTDECTAALILDIDPIQLVRNRRFRAGSSDFSLEQYVNDRPYVASSFLSVAIAHVFGSALAGQCKNRPELVNTIFPLSARISSISSMSGESIFHRLFEPLGYAVYTNNFALDSQFPEWGQSHVYNLEISANKRVYDLLSHLYVLIPVLDDNKHYYVGQDEIEKLMTRGTGWLSSHPENEMIISRYLRHQRKLTESALAQIREEDAVLNESIQEDEALFKPAGRDFEKNARLNDIRLEAAITQLKKSGAKRVLDLGCGEGKLIELLLSDKQFNEIVGMDVSIRRLANLEEYLKYKHLPDFQRKKLNLFQGSLLYRDSRLEGFDAAVLLEVIEHIEPSRLNVLERVVFESAHPDTLIVTTPNQEYNKLWPNLPAGKMRHPDHHFEWTRSEFQQWCDHVSQLFGYGAIIQPIGFEEPGVGAPTQMAIFSK